MASSSSTRVSSLCLRIDLMSRQMFTNRLTDRGVAPSSAAASSISDSSSSVTVSRAASSHCWGTASPSLRESTRLANSGSSACGSHAGPMSAGSATPFPFPAGRRLGVINRRAIRTRDSWLSRCTRNGI